MDDKLTIEELIAGLAAKQNIEQTDADAFVCSFFALIEEGLRRDKYVRIKGFGTFKLADTDLNEGRIVFVPEASVRDAVNKPFAHFQPVELRDGVCFSDVEEELASQPEVVSSAEEDSLTDDAGNALPDTVAPENEHSAENNSMDSAKTTDGSSDADKVCGTTVDEVESAVGKDRKSWYVSIVILLIGVIIGCGIMWGVFSGKEKADTALQYDIPEPVVVDTVSTDTVLAAPVDTLNMAEAQTDTIDSEAHKRTLDSIINATTENKKEIEYLSDEVAYRISGTIETYTITNGSTLSKVAYRFYKNRKLWPYIVMHNKDIIQDPNNVPIGTVLRIPVLTPVE